MGRGKLLKRDLKGGCYILGHMAPETGQLTPVIDRGLGAKHLSQYLLDLRDGPSALYGFGESDVILFAASGAASVTVSGVLFKLPLNAGLYIRPWEAFQIVPEGAFRGLITVCPQMGGPKTFDDMPDNFDSAYQERVIEADPARKETMGERFFQVLVSKKQGSRNVTQFIGEIPPSKAPSHHHLYEETLYVLEGEGLMWTEDKKAPVRPGSIVFLPKRQEHSLECTSEGGLKVAGHFYPAGSPAENY